MARSSPASRLLTGVLCASLVLACGATSSPAPTPGDSPAPTQVPATAQPAVASPVATGTPVPTAAPPPATAAQVSGWQAAAVAFADRFNELYADAPAAFAAFTDDAGILDPSNADFWIGPKAVIVSSWDGWIHAVDSYDARTIRSYVTYSAAAIETDVRVEWPAGEPALSEPLTHELRIFRFAGTPADAVTTFELWYRLDGLEAGTGTCFEIRDCGPALHALIDRYLAAWAAADGQAIASLYAPAATYEDATLAVRGAGPEGIAALAARRYGGSPVGTCSLRDTFLVMNDGDPSVADWNDPDGGKVAGMALVTTCAVGQDGRPVDSVHVVMLGTWTPSGYRMDAGGRIVSEEVFHDAASLVAAGVVD